MMAGCCNGLHWSPSRLNPLLTHWMVPPLLLLRNCLLIKSVSQKDAGKLNGSFLQSYNGHQKADREKEVKTKTDSNFMQLMILLLTWLNGRLERLATHLTMLQYHTGVQWVDMSLASVWSKIKTIPNTAELSRSKSRSWNSHQNNNEKSNNIPLILQWFVEVRNVNGTPFLLGEDTDIVQRFLVLSQWQFYFLLSFVSYLQ